ncbi:hypothetical protein [Streptomyces sp. NPDC004830]
MLRPVEHKLLVLPAPLPQGARVASSGEVIDAPDAFFDTWAGLAEQAIKQMHARFALPFRLTTALQRLNDSKTQV